MSPDSFFLPALTLFFYQDFHWTILDPSFFTKIHKNEQDGDFALKGGEVKWKSLSRVRLIATPWTIQSTEFSRPEYWSG